MRAPNCAVPAGPRATLPPNSATKSRPPVSGDDGQARISYEDFAVAVIDEIDQPRHLNRRFTVAY
ncbi:hypothetical protein SSPO_100770 [Streptomyces antimycoticus]|uniref:NAD(P)-binding domain-containing protein n=1 Tax=Streptomyces antimycoticus TaxID=68175 RepID=A0A499VEI8_9ACTN|nr:hypothetical protein SSPO_100770 [Streptomyces antimycoticus]